MRLMHVNVLCKTTSHTNFPFSSPEKNGEETETKNIFYEPMFILNWSAKSLTLPEKTNTSPKGTRYPLPP